MTTPRERQVEEFLRLLDAGDISLDYQPRPYEHNIRVSTFDLLDGAVCASLVSSAPDPGAVYVSDLAPIVITSKNLQGKAVRNGRFDADDLTFHASQWRVPAVGVVVSTRGRLLAYVPFPGPLVLTGSDVTISWHEDGIFSI